MNHEDFRAGQNTIVLDNLSYLALRVAYTDALATDLRVGLGVGL